MSYLLLVVGFYSGFRFGGIDDFFNAKNAKESAKVRKE